MDGAIIGIIVAFITLWMSIIGYRFNKYLQVRTYRTERMLERLFDLHLEFYAHMETSTLALSGWIVKGFVDFFKTGDLSERAFQRLSYYLACFLNQRKRLLKKTAGAYIFEEEKNAYYAVRLSDGITKELRNIFDEDDLKKLTELGDVDSFEDFRYKLTYSLRDKTKQAIEKLVKRRAKKMEKLLKLYSRILEQDRYSLYGIKGDTREMKVLYKQAEHILNVDEEKEKIEIESEKLKKDCELLTGVVDELKNKGYRDNQICTTKYLKEEILIFEKSRLLSRFLFRKKFPWVIFVKKSKKWQSLPVELFQYTTKFKYIKQALTESQKLKERLDMKIENLYDKEIKYVLTRVDCLFIITGIVISFLGFVVASGQMELLKVVSDYKLQVIGILIMLGGIYLLSIGIRFLKTINKKL